MFLYELISLYFPFEKQNLMSSQIEKLIIEGERPPLQSKVNVSSEYLDREVEREEGEREEGEREEREREEGGRGREGD